jgi:hypothetical protein
MVGIIFQNRHAFAWSSGIYFVALCSMVLQHVSPNVLLSRQLCSVEALKKAAWEAYRNTDSRVQLWHDRLGKGSELKLKFLKYDLEGLKSKSHWNPSDIYSHSVVALVACYSMLQGATRPTGA